LKRRLLAVVLAALLAVFGMVAVLAYVHHANERAVAGLKAEVVYAAKDQIPAGTSLRAALKGGLLTTEKEPVSSLPADPVQSLTAQNENLVTSGPVGQGQLLSGSMLVTANEVAGSGRAALAVPAGYQGLTIQVCPNEAVGGYIGPGSRVDIYGTYPMGQKSTLNVEETCDVSHQAESEGAVTTLLEFSDLEVLCVGQFPECAQGGSSQGTSSVDSATTDPAGTASSDGAVLVTLAVTRGQADGLITLAQVGLPYMTLPASS